MEKKRTPLAELIKNINTIIKALPDSALGAKNQAVIIRDKAIELLPAEREVIEKSCVKMVNIALDNLGNKNVSMEKEFENYYNETFKQ